MAQLGDSGYPTPGRAATTPAAPTPMAMTPDGAALSGGGAAALLRGMHGVPMVMQVPEEIAEAVVSRKDKSLGLLCDNFLQLFASGFSETVDLEPVVRACPRRRATRHPEPGREASTRSRRDGLEPRAGAARASPRPEPDAPRAADPASSPPL